MNHAMTQSSQLYCIARVNGTVTPLIPLDELPPFLDLPGIPRERSVNSPHDMIMLNGWHYHSGQYRPIKIKSPGGTFAFDGIGNLIEGDAAAWHHRNFNRPPKTFCSHWIRTGECDFMQQGCKFKHEMPMDKETLLKLGLRDIPRWYQVAYNVPSLHQPAANTNLLPLNTHTRLETLQEDAPVAQDMFTQEQQPYLLEPPPQLRSSFSESQLIDNTNSMELGYMPWTANSTPMIAPRPQRSLNKITQYGKSDETPSDYSLESVSTNTISESSSGSNPNLNKPFRSEDKGFYPSYDPWAPSTTQGNRQGASNNQFATSCSGSTMQPPQFLHPLRRTPQAANLRGATSARDVPMNTDNRPFPYRLMIPSISSPNLTSEYRGLGSLARPSLQSLASQISGTGDDKGKGTPADIFNFY